MIFIYYYPILFIIKTCIYMVCDNTFKALCDIYVVLTKPMMFCSWSESTVLPVVYTGTGKSHTHTESESMHTFDSCTNILMSSNFPWCVLVRMFRVSKFIFQLKINVIDWNGKANTQFIWHLSCCVWFYFLWQALKLMP